MRIAVIQSGAVLLDLKQNRYRGLTLAGASELAALACNWAEVSTRGELLQPAPREHAAARAGAFIEAGLLACTPPAPAFDAVRLDWNVQLTSVGMDSEAGATLTPRHVARFVRACLWARGSLRARSLYSIACEVSACKARSRNLRDDQRAIELVCAFRRLRPYAFEARDRCLFHALALLRFLSWHGHHPAWVIGVRARPWAAHSWLQLGTRVLDCAPEHVCSFTPIFAV